LTTASLWISLFLGPGLAAQAADAGGWSRFRGPNGSGVSTSEDLPVQFGPDRNVLWRVRLPIGHSSPVVWGDLVFVTGHDEDHLHTLCLRRGTGEIAWQRSIRRARKTKIDKRNNVASATPVASADRVVAFFEDLGLVAYDHAGAEQWRIALGPFNNVYGMGASPVIVDGCVYQVCDQSTNSFLLAVSADDGQQRWRVRRESATRGLCTPIV